MARSRRPGFIWVVLVWAGCAGAALGQVPGGGPMGGGRGSMRLPSTSDDSKCAPAKAGSGLVDRVNLELENSRIALGLTPEQVPGWARFEEASKKVLRDILRGEGPREVAFSELAAPQQIEQALDVPRNRLTALEEVDDSAKALYQSLNADQRKLADGRLPKIVRLMASGS